jgi:antitoxin VapB
LVAIWERPINSSGPLGSAEESRRSRKQINTDWLFIYFYISVYNYRKNGSYPLMPLSIKSHEAGRLARLLAKKTGESLSSAIEHALRERLERLQHKQNAAVEVNRLLEIADRVAALPVLDDRTPDEILGYDENGLPH